MHHGNDPRWSLDVAAGNKMIKFVMCITRHPDMTREQFRDYWENSHGPFFMQNAAVMGASRYRQCYTLDSPVNAGLRDSRGLMAEFDGVAEVWFDSEAALLEAMSSPEGLELAAALQQDENNFIDHARSSAFIVEEKEF